MDNIYPDRTNTKFDIKYAQLKALPSDVNIIFGSNSSGGVPSTSATDPSSGDTGTSERFGIEDILGTQDRSIDMEAYLLEILNAKRIDLTTNNSADASVAQFYADATSVGNPQVVMNTAADLLRSIITVTPQGIFVDRDSITRYMVTSVNGEVADTAGNLIIPSGGSGDTTTTLQQAFDNSIIAADSPQIISFTDDNSANLVIVINSIDELLSSFLNISNNSISLASEDVNAGISTSITIISTGSLIQTEVNDNGNIANISCQANGFIGLSSTTGNIVITTLPVYDDEVAATGGGLVVDRIYKTSTGELRIKL